MTGTLGAAINADGTRVTVTSTDGTNSFVRFFDATTGTQIGTTVDMGPMHSGSGAFLNVYGDRAVVLAGGPGTATSTSFKVAYFDTKTGTQLGSTVSVSASEGGLVAATYAGLFATDANHTVVLSADPNGTDTDVTLVSLT